MSSTAVDATSSSSSAPCSASRGARRSLVNDLKSGGCESNPCSPRLLNNHRKNSHEEHLLLLHYQNQMHRQQQQVLNSRRIYPSSSSSRQQQEMPRMFLDSYARVRSGYEYPCASDCSSHASPVHLIPRKSILVSKKMVVDEKQLALRLLRARSIKSSSCSSSSSSENASLRASTEDSSSNNAASAEDSSSRKSIDSGICRKISGANLPPRQQHMLRKSTAAGSSGRNSDVEEHPTRGEKNIQNKEEIPSKSTSSSSSSSLLRLKASDMNLAMQEHAFQCARDVLHGMDKLQCKKVAWELKKEFDKTYGPAWHCIVGTSFGSYVTHSVGGFVYFSIGKISVLLFQTAVELIEQH